MPIAPLPPSRGLLRGLAALTLTAGLVALSACTVSPTPPASAQTPTAATAPATESAVTGTASFRERIALPPNAVFEAELQDVSRADAPATVLGRDRQTGVKGPSIAFRIAYDPAQIQPNRRYVVRATIRVDGQLWFSTDTVHMVLTQGAGDRVDMLMPMVRRAPAAAQASGGPAAAPAPLTNTYWRLYDIDGTPVVLAPHRREAYLVLVDAGGVRNARALFGCNTLRGGYGLSGDELRFDRVASTQMACVPGLDTQEQRMKRLIGTTPLKWRIDGQILTLSSGAGQAKFEAVYLR